MDDALILEDSPTNICMIEMAMSSGVRYTIVKSTLEFRSRLSEEYSARFYFLDDQVPDENGVWDRCFIQNCDFLLGHQPEAKVFYIGSTIGPVEELYCLKHGITVIDKKDIAEFLESEEREASF